MNKICETLYHDNELQKKQLKENGIFERQLSAEKAKNEEIEQEI